MAKTIKQINDGIIASLQSSLNQTIPLISKSFTRVLAKSDASIFVMLEHYNNYMLQQWFVDTCSSEDIKILGVTVNPLNYWGNLIGLDGRKAGTRAELTISVSVEQLGGTIDAGTQLQSSINGFTYITKQSYTLSTNPILIDVIAADDQGGNSGVGSNGNLNIGDELNFVNPLAQVGKIAVITAQLETGADEETAEDYRKRVQIAFRRRKQGGALIDYLLWSLEVSGIRNAYIYTGDAGEVDVYVEATTDSSGNPDGIPTPTQLDAVKESIEYDVNGKASRRPVGSFVNTYPIFRTGFKVSVSGLAVDNPSDVQQQITDGLTDFFFNSEPFITGLSVPPRKDLISKIAVQGIIDDIVTANNGSFLGAELYLYATGSSEEIYDLGIGEKAKLSEIEFI